MKNNLVKNTIIIIICSLLIRVLALFNRVVLTRLLGNEGISLYMISVPSVMLFISIGGFSLNVALAKVVSENLVTNKYSNKQILKKALFIGLFMSLITSLLLLIIIKPLAYDWLKQPNSFYPILSTILFIPLVAINNVLRGYFNGLNKVTISSYSSVIEQVSRILIATALLYIMLPYGLVVAVTASIISMGFGELISLLYSLIPLRKKTLKDYNIKEDPTKEILSIAFPTTSSRLIGNLTYFLEPIIYTLALGILGFSSTDIMYKYSMTTAYALPMITMFSFVSTSIATSIMPNVSKYHAIGSKREVNYLVKKALILSFAPSILVTYLLINFSKEYMLLVYDTEIGSDYVKYLSIFFIIFYIQAPLVSIMQAIGKANALFKISIVMNIIKIGLIFGLSFISKIGYHSLIITMVLTSFVSTGIYYYSAKNTLEFKFKASEIYNLIILSIATFVSGSLVKLLIRNYLIATLVISVIFAIFAKILKLTRFCYEE